MTNLIRECLSNTELAPVVGGMATTAAGAYDLAEGNLASGTVKTILGMTAANLGTIGQPETVRNYVIKTTAIGGTLTVAFQGLKNCCSGIYEQNLDQVGKGVAQMATGVAGSYLLANLSSRTVSLCSQTISVAAFSGCVAYSGAKDIANGEYGKGVAKMAAGASGIALSGMVAYNAFSNPFENNISKVAADYPDPDKRVCTNPDFKANPTCKNLRVAKGREITIGSTYVPSPDPTRGEYAQLVEDNHAEYAKRWKLTHGVVKDKGLLDGTCVDPRNNQVVRCTDYWQKVPAMLRWLKDPNVPMGAERWIIDDDMPITNMAINPNRVFDQLAEGTNPSIILTRDSENWLDNNFPQDRGYNDPNMALNGGLWLLRKTPKSIDIMEKLWETRNTVHDLNNQACPTMGLCKNQDTLHEQQGMVMVLKANPGLLGRDVLIVKQRDPYSNTRSHIALNTSDRGRSCFIKRETYWSSTPYGFTQDDANGAWRPLDFMGQPNGVPPKGIELPLDGRECWKMKDNPNIPTQPLRKNRIQQMIDHTYRAAGCVSECMKSVLLIKQQKMA